MSVRITGGLVKARKLPSLSGLRVRPTSERVRGAMFSMIGNSEIQGKYILDLYSGTGALGIEALSRGARYVDFVEKESRQCQMIRSATDDFGFSDQVHIYQSKVEKMLKSSKEKYEIIFMDPPYESREIDLAMNLINQNTLLKANGLIVIEHSSRDHLYTKYGQLKMSKNRNYGDTDVSIFKPEAI